MFGLFGFLASLATTLFNMFNVPHLPRAFFVFPLPPFVSVVRTCISFYSVLFVLACLCFIRLREPILFEMKCFFFSTRSGTGSLSKA